MSSSSAQAAKGAAANTPTSCAHDPSTQRNTGRDVNYYLVEITNPKRAEHPPYIAECEDIILALGMSFEQGCAFKAIWRACAAQHLGVFKKSYDGPVYDAEKQVHYSLLNLAVQKRLQLGATDLSNIVNNTREVTSNAQPADFSQETGAEKPWPFPEPKATPANDLVITFDDYQRLAMRTAPPNESLLDGLNHAALGFLTELAEVQAADSDSKHACEELGDVAWYIALATAHLDTPLGTLMGYGPVDELYTREVPPVLVAAGRYATDVKRAKIYGKELTNDMRLDMLAALHDLMCGVAVQCRSRGIKLSWCLKQNIDKLRKRFPDKFSGEAAEARADKGGRPASES